MTATVATVAYLGLEARAVEVQVQLIPGLPAFHVVGLADKAVAESRERVRGAVAAMGLALPPKRIVVNLSPADIPKEGSHYDLPVALGLLAAMGVVDAEALADYVVVGELGLDARIQPSPGVLLAALHAAAVGKGLICPAAQGSEAAWSGGIEVLAAPDLLQLLNHLKGHGLLKPPAPGEVEEVTHGPDLKQVKGQETAKRALEIAAAGGHNLLMVGPPGLGQVADGELPARHPAAARRGRGAGDEHGAVGRGHARRRPADAQPAVPCAPSLGVHGGADRRRAEGEARARSASRISASCSSTSCPSSGARCSIRCASRWRQAPSAWRAPTRTSPSRRGCSSSRR